MMRSLYNGITGLQTQQQSMAVISDNIANVSTPGFKTARADFENVLNSSISAASGYSTGTFHVNQVGNGARIVGVKYDWAQGSIEASSRVTDLAISGGGFFRVNDDGVYFYTRAGSFNFDINGDLVNPDEHVVQGYDLTGQVLPLPEPPGIAPADINVDLATYTNISIDDEGVMYGIDSTLLPGDAGYGEPVPIWQVALFDFDNIDGLSKLGVICGGRPRNPGRPRTVFPGGATWGRCCPIP
ncbi:MAG: flagellar hook basal-body protein [Desulfobacterales bacterium]